MCAEDAFVVAQPSTPASYFHLLRQHSLGEEHRPLIVFTPKSMLKRKEAASQPDDFTEGTFRPLIGDADADAEAVDTLLLCSGRVTWDLMVERTKREDGRAVRDRAHRAALPAPGRRDPRGDRAVPQPQGDPLGAGRAAQHGPVAALPAQRLAGARRRVGTVEPVTREASSSPSVGTVKRHPEEQKDLLARAFAAVDPRAEAPSSTDPVMYFTDRGIEELEKRRGDEEVTLAWLAERLQEFIDTEPRVRDAGRALRHLAGPARRPRGLTLAYPPAPWQLHGDMWLSLFRLTGVDGRPAGVYGAAFVTYGAEPADVPRAAGGPAADESRAVTVTDIWVDSPDSMAGGRELWAIPKDLCDFGLESAARPGRAVRRGTRRWATDRSPPARFTTSPRSPRRCRSAAPSGRPVDDGTPGTAPVGGRARTLPARPLGRRPRRPARLPLRSPHPGVLQIHHFRMSFG